MRLFVGNLPFATTDPQLMELFSPFGCTSAETLSYPENGRARGCGYVEISETEGGNAAIAEMNGKPYGGRPLKVEIARPRRDGGFERAR
ncbi:MAG TPA: hypothetical protein VMV27_14240 [Candidatus Binataceae bacterium]|nr:hypothetical protein [Candidatus Binataceae bacterium]